MDYFVIPLLRRRPHYGNYTLFLRKWAIGFKVLSSKGFEIRTPPDSNMNLLLLIEKLIIEHGSSSIMKERLVAIKEELSKIVEERDSYKKQANNAQKEMAELRAKIEHYQKKDGFVEHRGALFKKKSGGGYEVAVYCPICYHAMSSLMGEMPFYCERDKQKMGFTGRELDGILKNWKAQSELHHIHMKIIGSVLKEQGVTFAILLVRRRVIQSRSEADKVRQALQGRFPSMPLILASQDAKGFFEYQGRPDIVRFLSGIDPARIPWKKYDATD